MNEPVTLEGWQAWGVARSALSVLVVGVTLVRVLDQGSALRIAQARGYDLPAVAALLPFIAAGIAEADGERLDQVRED